MTVAGSGSAKRYYCANARCPNALNITTASVRSSSMKRCRGAMSALRRGFVPDQLATCRKGPGGATASVVAAVRSSETRGVHGEPLMPPVELTRQRQPASDVAEGCAGAADRGRGPGSRSEPERGLCTAVFASVLSITVRDDSGIELGL